MGTDLLSDVCREIDACLEKLRPALIEYEQLLQAAEAFGLNGGARTTQTQAPPRHRARAGAHRSDGCTSVPMVKSASAVGASPTAPAFACHGGVERERVEVILDRAETTHPYGASPRPGR